MGSLPVVFRCGLGEPTGISRRLSCVVHTLDADQWMVQCVRPMGCRWGLLLSYVQVAINRCSPRNVFTR